MQTCWWPFSDHWGVHLTCQGLCGMGGWKLIGATCAMSQKWIKTVFGMNSCNFECLICKHVHYSVPITIDFRWISQDRFDPVLTCRITRSQWSIWTSTSSRLLVNPFQQDSTEISIFSSPSNYWIFIGKYWEFTLMNFDTTWVIKTHRLIDTIHATSV